MKKNVQKIIIMYGAPGGGKGTQAEIMSKKFGLIHFSTGDLFRTITKSRTDDFALKIKAQIDNGVFVSDEIVMNVLKDAIENTILENGFILDGFPRNSIQDDMLTVYLKENFPQAEVKYVYLFVPEEELINRLLLRAKDLNRPDDNIVVIKTRLDTYRKETEPIMDHLEKEGRLITIDCTSKSIPEVWEMVKELI
ncbi:MAG: nucleoside monophosphate kinase [candidate division SR1 bacterium]|nr:nucleoside monophosphate kinase [candidate division SR1 bacterium]